MIRPCPQVLKAIKGLPKPRTITDELKKAIPSPRLRNLKEKTLKYLFHIIHILKFRNVAADTISHNPVGPSNHLSLPDDANLVFTDNILPTIPLSFLMAIRAQPDMPTLSFNEEDSLEGVRPINWSDIRVATNSDN
ncbi:hypothetical protein PoB_003177500 [Plakobranchus ocellatus]|uniref:Uncharacterized protein n=1 Tax=Plakobranchus ocellatus TaxID=259542 RepID=A0AAV4AD67_9GAST|nr:hypothetical protein PoB_003177500 [Plakobranchus ocellatus]